MQYRVIWEIKINANTPEEAAWEALRIHRDPDSESLFFTVEKMSTGEKFDVDLLGGE
ncbi:MAG: hypothetical protein GF334_10270 [Candidatus Altiarchaeales archaeon]|nr:hypothetical protein [Candidatus Altiarchaeales archaeon]